MRFPFDCKTPIGYIVGVVCELVSSLTLCHTGISGLGILIGYFGNMMTTSEIIQSKFRNLNKIYKNDKNTNIRDELRKVIEFHSEIKELSTITK